MSERATELEQHYTTDQIARAWSLDPETVQRMFANRPGVIKLGSERRRILRIPASVYEAVRREKSC